MNKVEELLNIETTIYEEFQKLWFQFETANSIKKRGDNLTYFFYVLIEEGIAMLTVISKILK